MYLNYFEFCRLARAIMDVKLIAGEGIKRRQDYKIKISDRPCPRQEGSVECGFFVFCFIRDIVSNANELYLLQSKAFYTCNVMDSIRGEWSKFVMQLTKYDM